MNFQFPISNFQNTTRWLCRRTLHPTPYTLQPRRSGFTLIELIVVVGILVIVSSIILANHAAFGEKILLRNLAYDVALSIREAQVYGISARSSLGASSGLGHGVYVDISSDNTTFLLYTDINGNKRFTEGNETINARTYTFSRGYHFSGMCTNASGACDNATKMSILFVRPEPDAIIYANGDSGPQASARLILESPRGDKLAILVEAAGQISVENVAP